MRLKYIDKIRQYWNSESESYCSDHEEHLIASLHPSWGLFHCPEKDLRIVSDELSPGTRLLDLGCGRGHDAAGYGELGADVIAIDLSEEQIRRAIAHPKVTYTVSSAEAVPIDAGSIDIVISDHGAFDHSPPSLLLNEMNRVLKPSGILAICTYSPLAYSCYSDDTGQIDHILHRPYPRDDIRYDGKITAVEFTYSGWIKSFYAAGFEIVALQELMPTHDALNYYGRLVDAAWASRWPCDIIWKVRKKLGR